MTHPSLSFLVMWLVLALSAQADASQCTALAFANPLERSSCQESPLRAAYLSLDKPEQHTSEQIYAQLRALLRQLDSDPMLANYPEMRSTIGAIVRDRLARIRDHAALNLAALRLDGPLPDHCDCHWMSGGAGERYTCYTLQELVPHSSAQTCSVRPLRRVTVKTVDDAMQIRAYYALSFAALQALGNKPARDTVHEAFETLERQWLSYRKKGYLQYPWELAINGVVERRQQARAQRRIERDDLLRTLRPPTHQWIVLRPIVGIGLRLERSEKNRWTIPAQGVVSAGLEGIGWLANVANYRHYFGGSLGVTVDNLTFDDPRVGAFVHLSWFAQLGYSVSLRSESSGEGTFFASTDLGVLALRAVMPEDDGD